LVAAGGIGDGHDGANVVLGQYFMAIHTHHLLACMLLAVLGAPVLFGCITFPTLQFFFPSFHVFLSIFFFFFFISMGHGQQ
jgi:hypothetical protein